MRIVLILAYAILLKNVYCDSSSPLPNSPLNSLQRAPPSPPPPSPPPPSPQVRSYILAASWPPGVCTGKSGVTCQIKPVPTEFTIHGLWPNPDGAPSNETFDLDTLASLTSELNKNWPNLKSAQQSISVNLAFWLDEWSKHGKYSELGMREYFEKSLQLLKDDGQGLKAKLAAENVRPSIYNTYELADIEAAVKKVNDGFSGTIICYKLRRSIIPTTRQ